MPLMKGRNIAIMSRSGGHGVITADACVKYGFNILEFPESFIKKLQSIFDFSVIKIQNPLDLGEILDYTLFSRILEEALKLDEVDGIISFLNYQPDYEAAMARTFLDDTKRLSEKYNKPVAQSFVSSPEELLSISTSQPYPIFPSTLQAAQALGISRDYLLGRTKRNSRGSHVKSSIKTKTIDSIRKKCKKENRIPLTDESLKICSSIGLNVIPGITLTPDESIRKYRIKFPAALKLLSRNASHKSDVGGVVLNLNSKDEISLAIEKMKKALNKIKPKPAIDGFLVQQMAPRGEEFFIGGRQDPAFGPIVIAGFGGIFLEVIKDTSIRVAPVTKNEALDMLAELKMYPVIKGIRGRAPLDIDAMADAICRISSLLDSVKSIKEIDLNPVMVYPDGQGLTVVDARVFFE
jgi:acetyltransferase